VNVPWNATSGAAIGADWLLHAIAPAGDFGRRVRAGERAFGPGDEAAAAAAIGTVESIAREVPAGRLAAVAAAIAEAPDPGGALARASGGAILDDVDFFELLRFLDTLAEVESLATYPLFTTLLTEPEPESEPAAALAHSFAPSIAATSVSLRAELAPGRTAERAFYLADEFSAALAEARGTSASAQARYDLARGALSERIARYANVDHVRDGEFVLLRERIVPPLPAEIRVVREAPTYLLCELALDPAALGALSARDRAVERVATEEERVRARLSTYVATAAPMLEAACSALGALDVLVARARFAQRFSCVRPEIALRPAAEFDGARYLPLLAALGEREGSYAPVALELEDLGVVTGPNMGGKTAALRTLGFMVACVALGVPVPAARARIPLVDEIVWLGLGALPEDDALLSAFGTEVVDLRAFLERRPVRALALIDEFARTTSPREGRALLVALIETLRERGAFGLAATHFTGVAASARAPHYSVGGLREFTLPPGPALELGAALERIARATDYRLTRVEENAVPQADALALAEALGLEPALLARAWSAL
jgi:hypothetical protein